MLRAFAAASVAFVLSTCSPPNRDIRVVVHKGQFLIDFPFSLRRLIGLQNRDYCISGIEMFDRQKLLWTVRMIENQRSCRHVTMPIALGKPLKGFVSFGRPAIAKNALYGIAIDGIGDARVDFVVDDRRGVQNFTAWKAQFPPPCGSYFGSCSDQLRMQMIDALGKD